jgi:threonine dehydrogenase-like Zn-dependent dehydrogenase
MRAAVYHGKRDVRFEERPIPTPGPGEVRVKVGGCGLCGSDRHLWELGLYVPGVVPGHEMAGPIDALGPGVLDVHEGQSVAVEPLHACGHCPQCLQGRDPLCDETAFYGVMRDGGFAEYAVVPAGRLFPFDPELDVATAALAEPAGVAVHGLRRADIQPGKKVLVLGAGPIGLMTLLAARRLGAGEVTISARHPWQAEAARRLGADRVLTEAEASPQALAGLLGAQRPEIVAETVGGSADTLEAAAAGVAPGGAITVLGLFTVPVSLQPHVLFAKEVTLAWSNCYSRPPHAPGRADFADAVTLVEDERERLDVFTTHSVGLDEIGRAYALAEERPAGLVKLTVRP